MQPHSEQNRQKNRKSKSRKARRHRQQEQRKFLRQNSWLILLAVLALVALILFICVITGGREEPQQDTAQTEKTSRYEKAYALSRLHLLYRRALKFYRMRAAGSFLRRAFCWKKF